LAVKGGQAGTAVAVALEAEVRERPVRTVASVKSEVRVAIVATVTSASPHPEATWSHRAIAQKVAGTCFASVSASQVGRILADLDLKPHKVRGWLTRRETPGFWQRAAAVCALYLDPPEGEVVLSIDEKTAIAARSRRHPGQSARPGEPARQEFEYRRHGTASLVAALDVRTGEVLTEVIVLQAHRQGESDLIERDGVFYLVATCDVPEAEQYRPDGFIGVDLGIENIATASTGYLAAGRGSTGTASDSLPCGPSSRRSAPGAPGGGSRPVPAKRRGTPPTRTTSSPRRS
jgi:hypothetical protein